MIDRSASDVLILGGGASGLFCALHAARHGLRVRVLEKNRKVGIKILVSGGGRCNFTNIGADPRKHYLSDNQHFCLSAMRRYQPDAFITMVEQHGIAYHEKKLGQLFCDHSARQIVEMLVNECTKAGVEILVDAQVTDIERNELTNQFSVASFKGTFISCNVVIATGGLSMPKVASDFAYRAARKFNSTTIPTRPALVPLQFNQSDRAIYGSLSGISAGAQIACGTQQFTEDILFTHRGLSGPGILQISSYWREGESVRINLLPDLDVESWLTSQRTNQPKTQLGTALKTCLARRLVDTMFDQELVNVTFANLSTTALKQVSARLTDWQVNPVSTEGYKTAEVTLGGISTQALSSKTMAFNSVPGLFAIGEAVDVTGWLGGYNFQWAWASGYACAQALMQADS